MKWESVIEKPPALGKRVFMTNRFNLKDENGKPKLIWVGVLYRGTCGQIHGQTDDYSQVKSVTHYCEIPE